MTTRTLKRALLLTTILTSLASGGPVVAGPSLSIHGLSKHQVILCKPGYVYRCNKYGCFCVKLN